jgi:hypothetical protein
MRQVAARDDDARVDMPNESVESGHELRVLLCADMQVGYVKEADGHARITL